MHSLMIGGWGGGGDLVRCHIPLFIYDIYCQLQETTINVNGV